MKMAFLLNGPVYEFLNANYFRIPYDKFRRLIVFVFFQHVVCNDLRWSILSFVGYDRLNHYFH